MRPERVGIKLQIIFHPPEAADEHRSKSGGADLVFGVASQVVAV